MARTNVIGDGYAASIYIEGHLSFNRLLPQTMTKGTIAKWLKAEGDEIKPGDGLAELETDKATVTFEATDDAFLAKILVGDGSQVSRPVNMLCSRIHVTAAQR